MAAPTTEKYPSSQSVVDSGYAPVPASRGRRYVNSTRAMELSTAPGNVRLGSSTSPANVLGAPQAHATPGQGARGEDHQAGACYHKAHAAWLSACRVEESGQLPPGSPMEWGAAEARGE